MQRQPLRALWKNHSCNLDTAAPAPPSGTDTAALLLWGCSGPRPLALSPCSPALAAPPLPSSSSSRQPTYTYRQLLLSRTPYLVYVSLRFLMGAHRKRL